jgi:hypothetical protein
MGKYRVKCKICGKLFICLEVHLKHRHNLTIPDYKKKFPNSSVCSLVHSENCSAISKQTQKRVKERRGKDKKYDNWFYKKRLDAVKKSHKTIEKRRTDTRYDKNYIEVRKRNLLKTIKRQKIKRRMDKKYNKWFLDKCRTNQKNNIKKIHKSIKLNRETDQEYEKKYLNQRKKNIVKTLKIVEGMRKKNPDFEKKYLEIRSKNGRKAIKKCLKIREEKRKRDPVFDKKLGDASRRAGLKTIKELRKGYIYKYLGVCFDSGKTKHSELKCAKSFHEWFNWIPKDGKNCHIQIGGKEIDFKINKELITEKDDVFIEFHPFDLKGKSLTEYYIERRKILDKNGFKKNKLFVLKNFNEVKNCCILLSKNKE